MCVGMVGGGGGNPALSHYYMYAYGWLHVGVLFVYITGYGSTLYIGIAIVFVFSPYIWKFTSCFQFQVNLTFNDLTAQNMSKVICAPNISLNYHFLTKL